MFKTSLWIAILWLGCAVGLCRAATTEPAKSLLPSGNFLSTASEDWPAGWGHPEGASWEKGGDGHFLRLKSSKPGQTVLVYTRLYLPTPTPPALEISMKVRYTGIKAGEKNWFDGRIISHFENKTGRVLKPEPETPAFLGSSDGWVERKYVIKVPMHTDFLEIMPCMFQAAEGTLDIGRYDVYPATADQLPKFLTTLSETLVPAADATLPPELHVDGTQLKTKDGKVVWLQGLCVDSLQWSGAGDRLDKSVPVAIEQWKANVIRLPIGRDFWAGRGPWQGKGGDAAYRKTVDSVIEAANKRGAYVVVDLHGFGAPMPEDLVVWKDVAKRYKNHPGVLFELFNEPHDISWKVWHDGGDLMDPSAKHKDEGAVENTQEMSGEVAVGLQTLVDAVRDTGAKNIVIAGGLDWSYDLTGVVKDYALQERADGNGIMYSWHVYPWKSDWQGKLFAAADKYPIFVGEVGCPQKWEDFSFIPVSMRKEKLGPDCTWSQDTLGLIQKRKLNWTGFSFHPACGPCVISDWNYTPTTYWGVFVKQALSGTVFETQQMR